MTIQQHKVEVLIFKSLNETQKCKQPNYLERDLKVIENKEYLKR